MRRTAWEAIAGLFAEAAGIQHSEQIATVIPIKGNVKSGKLTYQLPF